LIYSERVFVPDRVALCSKNITVSSALGRDTRDRPPDREVRYRYEIDSYNALTVLLCGLENISSQFGLSSLEPLANSITITIHVEGLPKEETFSYIEQRISSCGNNNSLFTKNALSLTHQASGGIMRNINTIAHAAMLNAYMKKSVQVEAEHVKAVIERHIDS